MALKWSLSVSDAEMRCRAGGRRHYNHWRRHLANDRRRQLVEKFGMVLILLPKRGQVKAAADAFGVSRHTIWRDCALLRRQWYEYLSTPAGWRRVMGVRASQER